MSLSIKEFKFSPMIPKGKEYTIHLFPGVKKNQSMVAKILSTEK